MDRLKVIPGGSGRRPPRLRVRGVLAAVSLMVGLCAPVAVLAEDKEPAQVQDLPEAEVILDKMIEALGGKAALERITNRVSKGSLEFVGQGIKASATVYESAPNKMYFVMEAEGLGKFERGTNGKICWENNPMQGARIMVGKEKDFLIQHAKFNKDLHWREVYKKAQCVGIEDAEGKSCYKLVMTPIVGKREKWYIDKATYLPVQTELTVITNMGNFPVVAVVSDYKKVDGVMVPYRSVEKVMGMAQAMTVESVEHNVDMPADRFEPPEAVKALMQKEKEKNEKQ